MAKAFHVYVPKYLLYYFEIFSTSLSPFISDIDHPQTAFTFLFERFLSYFCFYLLHPILAIFQEFLPLLCFPE